MYVTINIFFTLRRRQRKNLHHFSASRRFPWEVRRTVRQTDGGEHCNHVDNLRVFFDTSVVSKLVEVIQFGTIIFNLLLQYIVFIYCSDIGIVLCKGKHCSDKFGGKITFVINLSLEKK